MIVKTRSMKELIKFLSIVIFIFSVAFPSRGETKELICDFTKEQSLPDGWTMGKNVSFKNVNGSELLFELDKYGICASAGSACSTSNPAPSHVLTAIGLDKNYIGGTLRVSFGRDNTMEDVDFLVNKLKEFVNTK